MRGVERSGSERRATKRKQTCSRVEHLEKKIGAAGSTCARRGGAELDKDKKIENDATRAM